MIREWLLASEIDLSAGARRVEEMSRR
ncbi:MAG: hypothetical protein LZF60_20148 [Nitrospira sp.]|nr:MAG: hypothetical protein LZF60_20148 [Nitrospira sp.]